MVIACVIAKVLADRILVFQEFTDESLIHNGNGGTSFGVGCHEVPACNQRNSGSSEEVLAHAPLLSVGFAIRVRNAGQIDVTCIGASNRETTASQRRRAYARNGFHTLDQLLVKRRQLICLVASHVRVQPYRQDVIAVKTRVERKEIAQGLKK